MKSLAFILISTLCFFGIGNAYHGCESEQMNALCQSKVIDNCFICENTQEQRPVTCVPVFRNNLGVLENYPVSTWNCTIYRPTTEVFDEVENTVKVETQDYQVTVYVSPWGSKSQCITKDYKEICSDSVTKSCFDCRTPTLLSYYHLCFPLFASENESALVTRLKKDKWECKKFSNPKYKPTSFQVAEEIL